MSETLDRDPFALGGRSADTATESGPDSAGKQPAREVRIASLVGSDPASLPPKEPAMPDTHAIGLPTSTRMKSSVRAAFDKWRAALIAVESYPNDDDLPDELTDPIVEAILEIARSPANDLADFAIKMHVALYQSTDLPQLAGGCVGEPRATQYRENGELDLDAALWKSLASDTAELVPELAPLTINLVSSSQPSPTHAKEHLAALVESVDDGQAENPVPFALGGYANPSGTPLSTLLSRRTELYRLAELAAVEKDDDKADSIHGEISDLDFTIAFRVADNLSDLLGQAHVLRSLMAAGTYYNDADTTLCDNIIVALGRLSNGPISAVPPSKVDQITSTGATTPEELSEHLSDEIIVDEEGKRSLALVVDEPVLGPAIRELFEIEEEQGNMVGGSFRNSKRCFELDRRQRVVWPLACSHPGETIGAVAWRLMQVRSGLRDCDYGGWIEEMLDAAIADALRLAQTERGGPNQDSVARLAAERHRLIAKGTKIVAWGSKLYPGDLREAEYNAQIGPVWDALSDVEAEMMETVATTKAGLIEQVDLLREKLNSDDQPLVETLKAGIAGSVP